MEIKHIRAIFLDLDDTLYFYPPCDKAGSEAVYAFLGRQLKISRAKIKETYRISRKEIHQEIPEFAASHSRLLYIKRALEKLTGRTRFNLSLAAESIFWKSFSKTMKPRPGLFSFLRSARSKGLKIVIITNLTTGTQMQKIVRLKLQNDIDLLVSSEEAGKEKPARDAFRMALKKLGLKPNQVLMIGDNHQHDIISAISLGMQAILLQTDSTNKIKDKKILVVKKFLEIEKALL